MDIVKWLKDRYNINAKDVSLYRDAFTHASYVNETDEVTGNYERLEFMGDAVVQIWVSNRLYFYTPAIPEGKMSHMRAQLVCEKSLANFFREQGLQKFIRLGFGEEKSNGRERDSLLCDVFEAFMAAIYLDQGYEAVDKVLSDIIKIVYTPELTGVVDYKSRLQEFVQADSRKVLKYQLLSEGGTANNPTFEIGVYLDEVLLGVGIEHSKKKAEQLAAKEALSKMAV